MALSDLVQEAERYLEDHVGAVKDLVQLVPRLERLVSDLETGSRPKPTDTAPADAASETPPPPPEADTADTSPEGTSAAGGAMPWSAGS